LNKAVEIPRDTVVRLAERLGAERVVIGSIVGGPARLVVRASVLRVAGGGVIGDAVAEGSADSITALVDQLAMKLLTSQAGEDEPLGSHTTTSLRALRAYLAAQAAFRANDYTAALRHYEDAVERDPNFALAALRLGLAADRLGDRARSASGFGLAWAARDKLSRRDLALLRAFTGPRFPAPSTAAEQIADWQRVVDLAPTSAEAWFVLGDRLFHEGRTAAASLADKRARAAFERALALDSNYVLAAHLMIQLALGEKAGDGTDAVSTAAALRDSLNPLAPFLRWQVALARDQDSLARGEGDDFRGYGPANLRAVALAAQYDVVGLDDAGRAIVALRERSGRRPSSLEAIFADHSLALNEGHASDALQASIRLRAAQPGSHAFLRLRVLDGLYGDGDSVVAQAAARELAALTGGGRGIAAGTTGAWLADACVLAQWRLAHADTTGSDGVIRALRSDGGPDGSIQVSAFPAACAELLETMLSVVVRRVDARRRLARLDSLVFTPQTSGDAAAYIPLLMARLHERVGDNRRALEAIRRRSYMTVWPRYLATMLREEGRLAELVGDSAQARIAYGRYLALRRAPDSVLVPQTERVRRALARLVAPNASPTPGDFRY
jgi:Tfp pilus assembly protein PilF